MQSKTRQRLFSTWIPDGEQDKELARRLADPFPGIRDPEPGTDFLPPDAEIPALPELEPSVIDLLQQIAANTSKPLERFVYYPIATNLSAGAGNMSFPHAAKSRFIRVVNAPRAMTVWAGVSRDMFLERLAVGQSLKADIPVAVDGLSIEYEAGVRTDFVAYLSSSKIDITVT